MKNIIDKIFCFLGFHKWYYILVGRTFMRRCLICGKKDKKFIPLYRFGK